jgi:hypothetical protein
MLGLYWIESGTSWQQEEPSLVILVGSNSKPSDNDTRQYDNNSIYLVRPLMGGWLHRSPDSRLECMPTGPLGSLTPCKSS